MRGREGLVTIIRMMARPFFRGPLNGLWAGAVVGAVCVLAIVTLDIRISRSSPKLTATVTSSEAAQSFVEAWRKKNLGTWFVDSSYVRTLSDGRTISGSIREVQRPPDHIRTALGSTTADLKGIAYLCAAALDPSSPQLCRESGRATDFQGRLDREMVAVTKLVTGDGRTYDVAEDPGNCYSLFLRPGLGEGQWGERAEFCFDQRSGAMTSSEIVRNGGTDNTFATSVSGDPSDRDFELPSPSRN